MALSVILSMNLEAFDIQTEISAMQHTYSDTISPTRTKLKSRHCRRYEVLSVSGVDRTTVCVVERSESRTSSCHFGLAIFSSIQKLLKLVKSSMSQVMN